MMGRSMPASEIHAMVIKEAPLSPLNETTMLGLQREYSRAVVTGRIEAEALSVTAEAKHSIPGE